MSNTPGLAAHSRSSTFSQDDIRIMLCSRGDVGRKLGEFQVCSSRSKRGHF